MIMTKTTQPILNEPVLSRDLGTPPPAVSLIQTALERGASVETIERLVALGHSLMDREAKTAWHRAFALAQAEIGQKSIKKSKHVRYTTKSGQRIDYWHAEISDVLSVVVQPLSHQDLSVAWNVSQNGAAVTVTCILRHAQGHVETVSMTAAADSSGSKNPVQSVGSTITYLQRYTLFSILGLAASEDDDGRGGQPAAREAAVPGRCSPAQVSELRALAVQLPKESWPSLNETLQEQFGSAMANLPQRHFQEAKTFLEEEVRAAKAVEVSE